MLRRPKTPTKQRPPGANGSNGSGANSKSSARGAQSPGTPRAKTPTAQRQNSFVREVAPRRRALSAKDVQDVAATLRDMGSQDHDTVLQPYIDG